MKDFVFHEIEKQIGTSLPDFTVEVNNTGQGFFFFETSKSQSA
jgi:hypothetical protein